MVPMDALTRAPSTYHPSLPPLPEATLPLWDLVPTSQRHYFNHQPPSEFHHRAYEFGSSPQLMPLVRSYLATCAAGHDENFQFVFTLLGAELASNAIHHSRSGRVGGRYTLTCRREPDGLHLDCIDQGDPHAHPSRIGEHLTPAPDGLSPDAESGRGLAMIDRLATTWGENGCPQARQVWLYLRSDLSGSQWEGT